MVCVRNLSCITLVSAGQAIKAQYNESQSNLFCLQTLQSDFWQDLLFDTDHYYIKAVQDQIGSSPVSSYLTFIQKTLKVQPLLDIRLILCSKNQLASKLSMRRQPKRS